MKAFTLNNKRLLLVATFLFTIFLGFGQEIVSYSSLANAACSGIIYNDVNISTTGICRGPGIVINGGGTYNSRDWTTTAAIDANDYLEWTITPNAGYQIDLTTIDIRYDRSNNGPTVAEIHVDDGSGFVNVFTDTAVVNTGEENDGIDLTGFAGVTGTLTFRLYAFSAIGTNGTFDIEEHTTYLLNKGIIVNGSVNAIPCLTTASWNGSNWIPASGPNSTTEVIIDGVFDTSAGFPQGSFNACSLTVTVDGSLTVSDTGFVSVENDAIINGSLSISNGGYISVNNDITINGSFVVDYEGSVVQIDDSAIVDGSATVRKLTAPMYNFYEYTYWSSPVYGETIANGLSDSDPTRRFSFEAGNFKDSFQETNNNNVLVAGHDDIDDNNDDWQFTPAATIMTPGLGYASHHEESIFIGPGSPPYQFIYTFDGPFNNGIISVPVLRNVPALPEIEEFGDFNWNLIGNPFPSAIDIDLFLTENSYDSALNPNGTLTGAIYLWSQDSPPSGTNNGNENQNFVSSDYAIINRIGEVPPADNEIEGGDGLLPARFIPSGQGFFVAYSDARPSATGDVIFNNSMRVTGNNDQFFRLSNIEDNTFALKLTSDNGIFNQMLVGYAEGATNLKDEMYYDAPRNLATGSSAIIYSIIEDSTRKFAIQGRDMNSMNVNDVIPIGIKSTINEELEFNISIATLEGEFMNGHDIYLRDYLLNVEHNLSESNYTFTSDAGEFNSRFEIFFSGTLSVDNYSLDSDELVISNNGNNNIEIYTKNHSEISNIKIYDLLGRELFDIEGENKAIIRLDTSSLSNSVYIINVNLLERKKLTKKFLNK